MATQFVSRLVQFATVAGDVRAAKLWLLTHAPKMTRAEKIDADIAVVNALAQKYGVEATESKRPLFSGYTFSPKGGDDAYKAACNCANVALHSARAVLTGQKRTSEKAPQVPAIRRAYETLANKVKAGDEDAVRLAKALFLLVKRSGN